MYANINFCVGVSKDGNLNVTRNTELIEDGASDREPLLANGGLQENRFKFEFLCPDLVRRDKDDRDMLFLFAHFCIECG